MMLSVTYIRETAKTVLWYWIFSVVWITYVNACGNTITGRRGEITSPNYPKNYANNLHCEWQISVKTDETIIIRILDMDIRVIYVCHDYLRIYDGASTDSKQILDWCGYQVPNPMVSSGNVVTLVFHTSYLYSAKGFRLIWRVTDTFVVHQLPVPWYSAKEKCTLDGGHLADFNKITLPSLEKLMDNNAVRLWISSDDEGTLHRCYSIGLSGESVAVESEDSCNNTLGFVCQKEAVVCGKAITEANGTLHSPGYPNGYPDDIFCLWQLTAREGYSVLLTLQDVNLEPSQDCSYDYVEIQNVSENETAVLQKLCGKASNMTFKLASSKVIIIFRSDIGTTSPGFTLDWISEMITTTTSHTTTVASTTAMSFQKADTGKFVAKNETSSGLGAGALVGIVLSVLFVIVVFSVVVLLFYKRYISHMNGTHQKQIKADSDTKAFTDNGKEEHRKDKTAQDLYTKIIPKKMRQEKSGYSSFDVPYAEPYSDFVVAYNRLNETENKNVNRSEEANNENAYDHLSATDDVKRELELDPDYDNSSSVSQLNVQPSITYDHLDSQQAFIDEYTVYSHQQ